MQGRGTKYIKQDSQMQKSNASDDIQVFSKMFVSCYVHVLSPMKLLGLECAISSFSEYILYAETSFHLRKS